MMDLLFKIPFEQRAKPKSPKNVPSSSTTTLVSTTLGDTTTTWEYVFSTLTTSTSGWLDDTTTTSTESTTRSLEKIVDGTSEKIERWDQWNQVIKEIFPGMAHWTIHGIFMSFYVNVCHFCRFHTHVIKCL